MGCSVIILFGNFKWENSMFLVKQRVAGRATYIKTNFMPKKTTDAFAK
jgi:hypothetical protein